MFNYEIAKKEEKNNFVSTVVGSLYYKINAQ